MLKRLLIAAALLPVPVVAQDAPKWRLDSAQLPFDLAPTRQAWISRNGADSYWAAAMLICDPDGALRFSFLWSPGDAAAQRSGANPLDFQSARTIAWRVGDTIGELEASTGRQNPSQQRGGFVRFSPAEREHGAALLDAMRAADDNAILAIGVGDRLDGWLEAEFALRGFSDAIAPMLAECRF